MVFARIGISLIAWNDVIFTHKFLNWTSKSFSDIVNFSTINLSGKGGSCRFRFCFSFSCCGLDIGSRIMGVEIVMLFLAGYSFYEFWIWVSSFSNSSSMTTVDLDFPCCGKVFPDLSCTSCTGSVEIR